MYLMKNLFFNKDSPTKNEPTIFKKKTYFTKHISNLNVI